MIKHYNSYYYMKTRIITVVILLFWFGGIAQKLPKVASGSIERVENFKSHFINARNVDIWLPKGYNATKKYAVLYMQDGQMLFDSTKPGITRAGMWMLF